MTIDVDQYLARIGIAQRPPLSWEGLAELQRAHMTAVPFENLHVFGRHGVRTGLDWSWQKVVVDRRGGWCFELNGLFAQLLEELGFAVRRIGAAVLLAGPTDMIDHLAIEVDLGGPYLVDVGFGEGPTQPLDLSAAGPQPGGDAEYEFIGSPKGTTLTKLVDNVPAPQYRFKRVTMQLADFDPASTLLQREGNFVESVFATRLLDGGPERVTLTRHGLKFHGGDSAVRTEALTDAEWTAALQEWFGLAPLGPPPQ